jgi:ADP-heptose:LPS heptosyltransferase
MKKIELFFKNILLKILLIISSLGKNKNELSPDRFSKVLFIRLNRIGDALVSTPVLHLIKKKINPRIYLLADKKNYFVYNNNPDVDKVIVFKKGFKGIKDILNFIKKENITTIVDLHDDVSATVSYIIALSGAENKFGLEKENKIIYTKTVPKLDAKNTHVITRLIEIAKLFNVRIENTNNPVGYYPSYKSLKSAEDILKKKFPGKRFLVGINISAGSEARFWGIEKFKLLIEFLLNFDKSTLQQSFDILILSAPKDLHHANKITSASSSDGKQVPVYCSEIFDEFSAVISNLNILFTPDTAAVHIASAFGIPVFGIYVHDTEDIIWSPYGVDFECVTTKESNLANINFEEVKNKFQNFLEKKLTELSAK